MGNIKKFVGDYAYSFIKNMTIDEGKMRKALVTPQNARNVFGEMNEFEIKSICTEISEDESIGKIRETTQEEIINAFASVGYDRVIFDDYDAIDECKECYASGERICTYNNLRSRMSQYHMLVAIKKDIDKIERSKTPERDDEYGTSILNVQIAKNGSHMSIKNRYNHTVEQCDSTLNNNLDMLYSGLQSMVLGYYNLAYLGVSKYYYGGIVVIDGKYIRNKKERDNVYTDVFVLDSENGVRFEDTSRYYVVNPISQYQYSYVLDFHAKEVLNPYYSKDDWNRKIPLINRALREGVIKDTNKTDSECISHVFPNAKKELLQTRKHSLQYLHEVYGYDLQQPFEVTAILGNFTALSIKKATGCKNGVLFMITDNNGVTVAELKNGNFNVETDNGHSLYQVQTFRAKGDFEKARKSICGAVYIVTQDEGYRQAPKVKYRPRSYRSNSDPVFDKSGCNLTEAHEQLRHRLVQYKEKKRISEVQQTDYADEIKIVKQVWDDYKKKLSNSIMIAQTDEDFIKIGNVTAYKMQRTARSIDIFIKSAKEKSFSSTEDAIKTFNEIRERIREYSDVLDSIAS